MSKGDKNRTKDREAYRETMERIKRNEEKKGKKDAKQTQVPTSGLPDAAAIVRLVACADQLPAMRRPDSG